MTPDQGTAVVSGALSMIGLTYAEYLAAKGFDLVLIAAHRASLNMLASDLTTRTRRAVEVFVSDDATDMADAAAKIDLDASVSLVIEITEERRHLSFDSEPPDLSADHGEACQAITRAAIQKFLSSGTGLAVYQAGVVITSSDSVDRHIWSVM
ncbi:hypothetical protein [Paraburkholderia sp. 22B1P]|uniref:hypothetical protein n=1 Tax=Paraburkholderia sp. 22B1P TaxID=3080498 RepID=UPI00308A363F|nr:SDR family NAD(P)-dependent oxidoreductase [Paraburkholderia sp. 22B1P]